MNVEYLLLFIAHIFRFIFLHHSLTNTHTFMSVRVFSVSSVTLSIDKKILKYISFSSFWDTLNHSQKPVVISSRDLYLNRWWHSYSLIYLFFPTFLIIVFHFLIFYDLYNVYLLGKYFPQLTEIILPWSYLKGKKNENLIN